MGASSYSDIKDSLRHLYLKDPRPWLVGFSGGKDSTMQEYSESHRARGLPDDWLNILKDDLAEQSKTILC